MCINYNQQASTHILSTSYYQPWHTIIIFVPSFNKLMKRGYCCIFNGLSLLFRLVVDVVKLSRERRLTPDGFLHHLLELSNVLVHQGSSIMVKGLLKICTLYVFQQVQQTHGDLIELINGLPPTSKNRKAHIAVLVDIWVQDFVETLDFRWFIGVVLCGPK